jgi:transposase
MDRTNWRWGKKDINILVLAVAYKGAAIPIYWMLLNKKGNSSTLERTVLVNRFIKQFGKKHILGLLADREFIGKKWFEWLKAQEIDFVIRIKKDAKTTNSQGQKLQVQHLFRFLKVGEKQSIQDLRTITDVGVYLTALRLDEGELLILAASKKCEQAIESYKERWQIETLFSCLKGRGFNLEDTHVTHRLRIKRLLIVPVIAFCWAHRTGEWQHENVKKIKVKKHQRLAKSIFRVGLELIRDALFKGGHLIDCSLKLFFQFIDFNNLCVKS